MSGRRDEITYLLDMIDACERVLLFSAGIADSELMATSLTYRGAVLHQLVMLGEAAKHVSIATMTAQPEIPWADVARLRDKLVHYYHGLDDALLLDVVHRGVPAIAPELRRVVKAMRASQE